MRNSAFGPCPPALWRGSSARPLFPSPASCWARSSRSIPTRRATRRRPPSLWTARVTLSSSGRMSISTSPTEKSPSRDSTPRARPRGASSRRTRSRLSSNGFPPSPRPLLASSSWCGRASARATSTRAYSRGPTTRRETRRQRVSRQQLHDRRAGRRARVVQTVRVTSSSIWTSDGPGRLRIRSLRAAVQLDRHAAGRRVPGQHLYHWTSGHGTVAADARGNFLVVWNARAWTYSQSYSWGAATTRPVSRKGMSFRSTRTRPTLSS